jgi:hypothetical protein
MSRKILAFVLVTVLIGALAVIPAAASTKTIGGAVGSASIVHAVEFDEFHEFTFYHHTANSSWFNPDTNFAQDNAYTHRPEFWDGFTGPQTENAEPGDLGNIGAVAWTSGPSEGISDIGEWVNYNIAVTTPGVYNVQVWMGSGADNGAHIDLSWNGAAVSQPTVGNTGWGNYELVDAGTVRAEENGVLRVDWPMGEANVAAFVFTLTEVIEIATEPADTGAADAPAAGAADAPAAGGADSGNDDGNDGNGMILWIIIAAAAVVVIVIIVILVTKKKK